MTPVDDVLSAYAARAEAARLRFDHVLQQARAEQERLLFEECIRRNEHTVFGREHGFPQMRTIDDFRRSVPIRNYDAFSPYLERMFAGEEGVLTTETPSSFSRTSGTGGRSKTIPSTATYRAQHDVPRVLAAGGYVLARHPELASRRDTTINFIRDPGPATGADQRSGGGTPYGSYVSNFAKQKPASMEGELGTLAPWSQVPSHLTDEKERHYFRLRHAVGSDLLSLMALNPSTLVTFGHLVHDFFGRLVDEVRAGTVLGVAATQPDPARAAALASLASERVRPRDLWPHVKVLGCWTGGSCALYLPELANLYGNDVEVFPLMANASEGPISMPLGGHLTAGALVVTDVFYEFVPADVELQPHTQTLLFDQLEAGKEYELVMTQPNGLYRYALGDVLRVVGHIYEVPLVEFVTRKGVASSFTGEKLTEGQVLQAMSTSLKTTAIAVVDVTCCPVWDQPPHYTFAVEPVSETSPDRLRELAAELDRQLSEVNDEYRAKRESDRLGPVQVQRLERGTFGLQRAKLIAAGASAVQLKNRVVQKERTALADLMALSDEARR